MFNWYRKISFGYQLAKKIRNFNKGIVCTSVIKKRLSVSGGRFVLKFRNHIITSVNNKLFYPFP